MEASAVARLLEEFGHRLLLSGSDPYRPKAYLRAADTVRALPEPLETIIRRGELQTLPGIGPAIAEKIENLQRTGSDPRLEALRRAYPSSLLELFQIPELRAPHIQVLHEKLRVVDLASLEAAVTSGQVAQTKGLGPALATKITQNLAMLRAGLNSRRLDQAETFFTAALAHLQAMRPDLTHLTPAGDYRRGCELICDLIILGQGDKADTFKLGEVEVRIVPPPRFGLELLLATGSAAHLTALRAQAQQKDVQLFNRKPPGKTFDLASEEAIYRQLGLPFIAPELREGRREIERAVRGELPKLVTLQDLRGILHAHTDRSDGRDTLADMAEATRSRGWRYFGVADHSQAAHYAGGLAPQAVRAQWREADRLNTSLGRRLHIFKGIEADILADGALDYDHALLAGFDFVVVSIHSRFNLSPDQQTGRLLRAVRNPFTTILGHMSGRLLLRRPGYDFDMETVLQACAENGVAVEINSDPHRLDLDWRWHQRALDLGCLFSINPDAHATDELTMVRWGVLMARKGGLPAERILNCMPRARLAAYFERRKKRAQVLLRQSVPDSKPRPQRQGHAQTRGESGP